MYSAIAAFKLGRNRGPWHLLFVADFPVRRNGDTWPKSTIKYGRLRYV